MPNMGIFHNIMLKGVRHKKINMNSIYPKLEKIQIKRKDSVKKDTYLIHSFTTVCFLMQVVLHRCFAPECITDWYIFV